jgi:hypothetical protein
MNFHRFNIFLLTLTIFTPISPTSTAAIFGDGNPANGIEDQRRLAPIDLQRSVGTVICDGGLRGTAIHINLMHSASDSDSDSDSLQQESIILTAAHVLYHPDTAQRYEKCAYHPQGKRFSRVIFDRVSVHEFRPTINNKIRQANQDIVFIALKKKLRHSGMKLNLTGQSSRHLQLLGFNESQNNISISTNCQPFLSQTFVSPQLLLHDCDAGRGASGGPLIDAETGTIVGIHGGTLLFSPPGTKARNAIAGASVDPETMVNQARKIDVDVLSKLHDFTAYLAKHLPY